MCLGVANHVYGGTDSSAITAADVAQILEKRYGLFSGFWEATKAWLTPEITEELIGPSLERVAEQLGHTLFAAISNGSIETMTHSLGAVPTLAAKLGINHRKGRPAPHSLIPACSITLSEDGQKSDSLAHHHSEPSKVRLKELFVLKNDLPVMILKLVR